MRLLYFGLVAVGFVLGLATAWGLWPLFLIASTFLGLGPVGTAGLVGLLCLGLTAWFQRKRLRTLGRRLPGK